MKRTLSTLSVLALVLVFSGSAFGQVSPNINANAEVITALSAVQHQEVDFAVIANNWSSGNEPTINPSDGTTSGNGFEDATGATVGLLEVSGTAGQTVDVTVATSITLSNTDNITFTPSYNWTYDNVTSGAPTNPQIANTGANFSMTLDGSTASDGTNTILIGGQLEAPSAALTSGSYTGSGTITIAYQ